MSTAPKWERTVGESLGHQTPRPSAGPLGAVPSDQLCHVAHTIKGEWVDKERITFNLAIHFITRAEGFHGVMGCRLW